MKPLDALLALFLAAYLALHWLVAVPVWDRYALPVQPLVAILIGRTAVLLYDAAGWTRLRPAQVRTVAVALFAALLLLQLPAASAARAGRYALGGQPGADAGAAAAATLLRDAPYGTVLYDHWYSWHWRYQLFDGRVYVSWFPHADALLADLDAFGDSEPARFIALPASAAALPVVRALSGAGYRLEPVGPEPEEGSGRVALYRIVAEQETEK